MRVPWLGDALRAERLKVVEHSPINRGKSMRSVQGVVLHDTVTTRAWTDESVIKLLRDGRPGVPGPLSQLGLRRDGTLDWISDGRCNHNGYGQWGNDCIGIEVYCAGGLEGREERWNAIQEEVACIASAAILKHLRLNTTYLKGHKETDPRRKIDPWRVDMNVVRSTTQRIMQAGSPVVKPTPAPERTWFDMATKADLEAVVRDLTPNMANDVVNVENEVYIIMYGTMQRKRVSPDRRNHFRHLAESKSNRQFRGPWNWDRVRLSDFAPVTKDDA